MPAKKFSRARAKKFYPSNKLFDRAKELRVNLPATWHPQLLTTLQLDAVLKKMAEDYRVYASVHADIALEERGVKSMEKDNIEEMFRCSSFACVIEFIRRQLLDDKPVVQLGRVIRGTDSAKGGAR